MTTVGVLLEQAKREILSGTGEQANKLSATVDDDATTLSFAFPLRGIVAGSVLEVELEQVYVWSADATAGTAIVERGWNGTAAVAHTAPLIVNVSTRFPRVTMLTFLNHELADLSSPVNGLFVMSAADLAYNQDGRDIPLTLTPAPLNTLYAVRYRDSSREWPLVRKWELVRDGNTAEFPSGLSLRLFTEPWSTGLLRIQWKSGFAAVSTLATDLASVTGGTELDEILKLGVQIRALGMREPKRNFSESQPEPRRAQEVPPGAESASIPALTRMRRDRVIAEAARLNARYPQTVFA